MGSPDRGTGEELIALARALIPASGNDFGSVARGAAAEAEFRARTEPLIHPDFETVWPGGSETTTGLEATMAGLIRVGTLFDRLVAYPDAYVPLDGAVLVLLHREGRTIDGIEFNEAGAVIYAFEDGLLRRMNPFSGQAAALREAGLTADEASRLGVPPV